MNGRGWRFWKHERAQWDAALSRDSRDERLPDECARWAPLLTALFDGEANEAQTREARRHLLRCERCAQTWLGWNQTRAFLLDHSVPPVPSGLVNRIRRACGLDDRATSPDLHAQILARTSRASRPRSRVSRPAFQLPLPLWGATAVGAFVLLLAGDSLLPSASSVPSSDPALTLAPRHNAPETERGETQLPVLPQENGSQAGSAASSNPSLSSSPMSPAERTLVLAQRERQSLGSSSHEQASPAALAVLSPLTPEVVPISFEAATSPGRTRKRRLRARSSLRESLAPEKLSSPLATPHLLASRPIFLAAVPAPVVETEATEHSSSQLSPLGSERRGRFLLASVHLERAPLRISMPRVRPITVNQDSASDGPGLDDLNSTVEDYRSSLANDANDSSGDAG